MPTCPSCDSEQTVKNGHIHNGKQRFKCHQCGRQFIENPQKIVINQEKQELIDRLRQRVSRLVRKTLSFSKSLENHIGAIWYFVHYYNSSLLV